jgi:hypothetical protein
MQAANGTEVSPRLVCGLTDPGFVGYEERVAFITYGPIRRPTSSAKLLIGISYQLHRLRKWHGTKGNGGRLPRNVAHCLRVTPEAENLSGGPEIFGELPWATSSSLKHFRISCTGLSQHYVPSGFVTFRSEVSWARRNF